MNLRTYIGRDRAKLLKLAEDIGVSPTSLYRYMSGDRMPRRAVMQAIVAATDGKVKPADFYATTEAA